MAVEYEIRALYEQFYGSAAQQALKNLSVPGRSYNLPDIEDIGTSAEQAAYAGLSNIVGYPIFMPVQVDGYWLPNEPLVTVGRSKRVVKTPLSGTNGTIKENMGLRDWEILIRGIATVDNFDIFPFTPIKKIQQIFEKRESVTILGPLFDHLRITKVAIERLNFPELQGVPNAQPYEIQAFSDHEGDLIMKSLTNDSGQI